MSKNLQILLPYLQGLGILVEKTVRDDHIGIVVAVRTMPLAKALKIAQKIARDNNAQVQHKVEHYGSGADVLTIPINNKGVFTWSIGHAGYSVVSVDIKKQERTTSLPKWSGRTQRVSANLWTTSRKPLLANWPRKVYHATTVSNAVYLLEQGSNAELFFGFTADLAISYGRSRFPKAALLELATVNLRPDQIEFDENTGGESFAYYGRIKGSNFTGYSI